MSSTRRRRQLAREQHQHLLSYDDYNDGNDDLENQHLQNVRQTKTPNGGWIYLCTWLTFGLAAVALGLAIWGVVWASNNRTTINETLSLIPLSVHVVPPGGTPPPASKFIGSGSGSTRLENKKRSPAQELKDYEKRHAYLNNNNNKRNKRSGGIGGPPTLSLPPGFQAFITANCFYQDGQQLSTFHLADVSTASPTDGQTLIYNAMTGEWEPSMMGTTGALWGVGEPSDPINSIVVLGAAGNLATAGLDFNTISNHITDPNIHFILNDAGSNVNEAWSSSKITAELATKAPLVHTHDAGDVVSGQFADARISQSSVIQHEGAIDHLNILNIGSNTHAVIDTHIGDVSIHFILNDAGISANEAWSSTKISTELTGKAALVHTHTAADVTDFSTEVDARITLQKAMSNGLATLDGLGLVPLSQLPLVAPLQYKGTWDADTNTPTLMSGVGTAGFVYIVNVAGATILDGAGPWGVGDWALFDGTVWQRVENTAPVSSVNGMNGAVVLTAPDINVGVFADAQISQSSVTQHEAAINHVNLLNVGTNSHAMIDAHIADSTIHFILNDAGTSLSEGWSSTKISTELTSKAPVVHTHDAGDVVSGMFSDARVSGSSVTQHESLINHNNLLNVGTNTHAMIDTHIGDVTLHRIINDAGTSATELWSANKIDTELASKVSSISGGTGISVAGTTMVTVSLMASIDDLTDVDTTTTTPSINDVLTWTGSEWEPAAPGGGGGGETNTASNVNVGGVGVFKQKTGVNLEFRGVNSASSDVSVTLDAVNNEIDISYVQTSFSATATNTVSTNSGVLILIPSMTLTPGAGTYLVMFSASGDTSPGGSNTVYQIFSNGVGIGHSSRDQAWTGGGQTNNRRAAFYTQAIVTVGGGQAIEVRYASSGTVEIRERSLILIKLSD